MARRKSSRSAIARRPRTTALAMSGTLVRMDHPPSVAREPPAARLTSASSGYAGRMKDRSVWPECRDAGTHRCAGSNATSECICWHHVLQQRNVEQALELLVQIERELEWIGGR